MKKKLFLCGMCMAVICMAAGCREADGSREKTNSTETKETMSVKSEEQEAVIDKEIMENLTFEKKTFPGVKDERNIPQETSYCPLHIEDVKQDGEYLYIADCQGGLYVFQWKEEKLERLLQGGNIRIRL